MNTPIKDSLQLTRQAREEEEMYLEKMHLSWIGPLGQEFFAEPLLREGARVTLYVGECKRQWHVYIHLKPMCCVSHSLAPFVLVFYPPT